jgi:hypothetical protein
MNPNTLDYVESTILAEFFIKSISESDHELGIFESTLALTQLSSLGTHITNIINKNRDFMLNLTNNLLEENLYIVHSSLELFNNIGWADDKFLK